MKHRTALERRLAQEIANREKRHGQDKKEIELLKKRIARRDEQIERAQREITQQEIILYEFRSNRRYSPEEIEAQTKIYLRG